VALSSDGKQTKLAPGFRCPPCSGCKALAVNLPQNTIRNPQQEIILKTQSEASLAVSTRSRSWEDLPLSLSIGSRPGDWISDTKVASPHGLPIRSKAGDEVCLTTTIFTKATIVGTVADTEDSSTRDNLNTSQARLASPLQAAGPNKM